MALSSSYAYIVAAGRSIGNIIPDVVIEEAHQDRLVVTQHPVEGGGLISDHAYKLNPVVEIRVGFSDSTVGTVGYSRAKYDALLKIQNAKQLVDVSTGKRLYRNMIPAGIAIVTDEKTENSLIAILVLEQVTVVTVQTTSAGTDTASVSSDPANQADPASTQSVTNAGQQSTIDIGPQAFAGAFNPGSTASVGDLGLGGAVGASLDGLSQPTITADVGEMTVQDGATGEVLQQGQAEAYNPFLNDPNLP